MAVPRRILYLVALGLLIIAGASLVNLVGIPGPRPMRATLRLLHDSDLLTIGPLSRNDRDRYALILKAWATERGVDNASITFQQSEIVVRGTLTSASAGTRSVNMDLTSVPGVEQITLFTTPLVKVTTSAHAVRHLTEVAYQIKGVKFSATVAISSQPFSMLVATFLGLLALGWLFARLVCALGRPSEWSDSRFTVYTSLAYLPAVGLLAMFTVGGYLPYLSLFTSPLAAYGVTMALMTTLIVVPGIALWKARYQGRDSLSVLPGWAAMLVLPPLMTATAHLAIGLWMPTEVSLFWWVPVDGLLQVVSLVTVVALAPLLLGARQWGAAPAGMFHRAWVVPAGKDGWANAFVMGMNPNRVNLFVTERLVQELAPGETAAVLAHERGHLVLGHLWKLPAIFLGLTLIVETVLLAVPAWMDNPVINDYGVLLAPLLVYFGTVPILMAVSRRFERAADSWACTQLAGDASHLATALSKLRHMNGGHRSRWLRWWASHPSIEERISRICGFVGSTTSSEEQVGM